MAETCYHVNSKTPVPSLPRAVHSFYHARFSKCIVRGAHSTPDVQGYVDTAANTNEISIAGRIRIEATGDLGDASDYG